MLSERSVLVTNRPLMQYWILLSILSLQGVSRLHQPMLELMMHSPPNTRIPRLWLNSTLVLFIRAGYKLVDLIHFYFKTYEEILNQL